MAKHLGQHPSIVPKRPFARGGRLRGGLWRGLLTLALGCMLLGPPATNAGGPERKGLFDSSDSTVGRWRNPRLGFTAVAMTEELRAHYGAPKDRGVLITQVQQGTPASDLGLRVGDVVVEMDGKSVSEPATLESRLSFRRLDQPLHVEVIRLKKSAKLILTAAGPPRSFGAPRVLSPQERQELIRSLHAEIERLESSAKSLRKRVRELEQEGASPEDP